MRKILCSVLTLCFIARCFSAAAAAAGEQPGIYGVTTYAGGITLSVLDAADNPVAAAAQGALNDFFPNGVKVRVTYADPTDGAQYVLFALNDAQTTPTEGNLSYIDQRRADGGSVSFTVYPDSLEDGKTYSIYLSGGSLALTRVGSFRYYVPDTQGDIGKQVIPSGDITLPNITVAFGQTYAPAASVADKPEYAGVTYTYTYVNGEGRPVNKPADVGTYTVTVTVENDGYRGTGSANLTITPKSLDGAAVTLPEGFTAIYNKAEHRPAVTVKDGENTLIPDRDYTVAYASNVNAGTAAVTVTGKGNYDPQTGKTVGFPIQKAALTGMTPAVSGAAEAGNVLAAGLDGVDNGELDWTWTVGADTANGAAYTIKPTDSNKTITVKAAARPEGNYTGVTLDSEALTVAKVAITGTVVITETQNAEQGEEGRIEAGDVLTATAMITPAVAVTWQWYNNGSAIEGANTAVYTVAEGDKRLTVTAVPGGDYAGSVASAAVEVGKRILSGAVVVAPEGGEAAVGGRLVAAIRVDPATAEDYAISWLRDNEVIAGAEGVEYGIGKEDQGRTISVKLTARGEDYIGELVSNGVAVPAAVPDAPAAAAAAGDRQVTLSWTVPADNGSPILGYTVQRDEEAAVTLAAEQTQYTFGELTNGITYTFRVSAVNAVGVGAAAQVSSAPKASLPPSPPPADTSSSGEEHDSGGSSAPAISIPSGGENGTLSVSVKKPRRGDVVTITATPDAGYRVEKVTVTDEKGNRIKVRDLGNGKYSFTMPGTKVILDAKFAAIEQPPATREQLSAQAVFRDVQATDWFLGAVQYVYENDLMSGVEKDVFAPDLTMNRGMLVTVLHRMEKEPAAAPSRLTDVLDGEYYANAVSWAAEKGIVSGFEDGSFRPDDPITREQLAAILYRYASMKGYDVSLSADLAKYPDAEQISSYARPAMEWANAAGIINGTDWGGLYPGGPAIRIEVAIVLERFMRLRKA